MASGALALMNRASKAFGMDLGMSKSKTEQATPSTPAIGANTSAPAVDPAMEMDTEQKKIKKNDKINTAVALKSYYQG